MLDDESNDPTTPDPTPNITPGPTTEPTTEPVTEPAPAKTVRRRRATQATAAPGPAADPTPGTDPTPDAGLVDGAVKVLDDPPGHGQLSTAAAGAPAGGVPVDGVPAGGGPADGGPADGAPVPAKRVRKAPAKKAAPRKRVAPTAAGADADAPPSDEEVAVALGLPTEPVTAAIEQDPAVTRPIGQDVAAEALVVGAQQAAETFTPDSDQAGQPAGGQQTRREATGRQPTGGQPPGGQPAGGQQTGEQPAGGQSAGGEPTAGQPTAGQPTAGQPTAGQPVGGQPTGAELPAEEPARRPRRRKAPAVVTFQAPEPAPEPALYPGSESAPEPGSAPDGEPVAEQPVAPRRRRRAGTTGAVSPQDLLPTLLAPEPAAELPVDEDAEPEQEEPDATAETPEVEQDEESDATAGTAEVEQDEESDRPRRRRRGRRGRGARRDDEADTADTATPAETATAGPAGAEPEAGNAPAAEGDSAVPAGDPEPAAEDDVPGDGTRRRRRRRRRSGGSGSGDEGPDDVPTVVHVREPRLPRAKRDAGGAADQDGVRGITGSTRMAAKRARRQDGRTTGRRTPLLSEAEFLARREAVDRTMVVRQRGDRTQIAVLEDGVLVEHYVTKASAESYAGNVYLGTVQNVLPSMEAAFVDIGKGKNGVLYAGEVSYDGVPGGRSRSIESVLKSGQDVLVQVSKDPIGHKGARLTSQISLPGRYLVYVPEGSMTGISRKLPETERARLKAVLKQVVPDTAGVIIRTAAEGASEEELAADVRRLQAQWEAISTAAAAGRGPRLLHAEPDLVVRVVRDVFNEDVTSVVVQGDGEWETIRDYVEFVAPDLAPRLSRHESDVDLFAVHRIDEQLAKALDRKVWLPSGGSLVIDRTEAMVVIDVNTGKYVGKGGNLEETVTRNNLEAAEEIARQLRLRDLGGIIVVDFIDMVLESNRDLVVRRLVECLGRDRTKHQVAEVTSLGLVQMTRKRVGQGLLESFSEICGTCAGSGVVLHDAPRAPLETPVKRSNEGLARVAAATVKPAAAAAAPSDDDQAPVRPRRRRGGRGAGASDAAGGAAEATPDDAPLAPEVADAADMAPDLLPELADQPTPAQEDVPVVPAEGFAEVDAEPVDAAPVDGRPVDAQPVDRESVDPQPVDREPVDREPVDVGPVDAQPVDVQDEPEPIDQPDAVQPDTVQPDAVQPKPIDQPDATQDPPVLVAEEPVPTPRRRRRATSRPAGPPEV